MSRPGTCPHRRRAEEAVPLRVVPCRCSLLRERGPVRPKLLSGKGSGLPSSACPGAAVPPTWILSDGLSSICLTELSPPSPCIHLPASAPGGANDHRDAPTDIPSGPSTFPPVSRLLDLVDPRESLGRGERLDGAGRHSPLTAYTPHGVDVQTLLVSEARALFFCILPAARIPSGAPSSS